MAWYCVLAAILLVSSPVQVQYSPCSWVEVVKSWSTGFMAEVKIQMEETVDRWSVALQFTQAVEKFEAWKGHVTKISDVNYTIDNNCYNSKLYSCQCFQFPYLVRHQPQWTSKTTVNFNGRFTQTCSSDPCSGLSLTDAIKAVEKTVHRISDDLQNSINSKTNSSRYKRQAENFSEDQNDLLKEMNNLLNYFKSRCILEENTCNPNDVETFRVQLESIFNNMKNTRSSQEFVNAFELLRKEFDEIIKHLRNEKGVTTPTCSNEEQTTSLCKCGQDICSQSYICSREKCFKGRCITYSYQDSFDLNQTLSVPVGKTIEVTFLDFDIEKGDYLEFFDGHKNSYDTRSSPRNFTILSSTASVVFHSDQNSSKKGFKFCYKSGTRTCPYEEKTDTPCKCGEDICIEGDTCSRKKCFIDCQVKIATDDDLIRKKSKPESPQECSTPPIKNNGKWQCSEDKKSCYLKCNPGYASLFSLTTYSDGVWTELDKMECEQSVFLLIGGNTDANDPKETYDIYYPDIKNLTCSKYPPKLNKEWKNHVTFVHNGMVYLCGGKNTQDKCTSLNITDPSYQWKIHNISSIGRYDHSAVVLQNDIYFFGGVSVINNVPVPGPRDNVLTSLPLETEPSFTLLPNISYNGLGQCVIKINENAFIVTGGVGNYSKKVTKYNITDQTSTNLPEMLEERYFHGCAMIEEGGKQWIVVTGGFFSSILNTTERLNINSGTHWESLGQLNIGRAVTTMDEVERGLIIFGGWNSGGKLDTVETLDWATQQWKIAEQRLKTEISSLGVVKIPSSVFNCDILDKIGYNDTIMSPGTIVVRNDHDWIYQHEDGGSGNQGVVKESDTENGWVSVEWRKTNITNFYRWGKNGKAEIKIYSEDNCETAMVVNNRVIANGYIGTIVERYDLKLEIKFDRSPGCSQTSNYTWNNMGRTDVNVYCEEGHGFILLNENFRRRVPPPMDQNVDIAYTCCFIVRSGEINGSNQTYILTNPFHKKCQGSSIKGGCAYMLYTSDENFDDELLNIYKSREQICLNDIKNPVCCSDVTGALCGHYGKSTSTKKNTPIEGICSDVCKEIADCSYDHTTDNWCKTTPILSTELPQNESVSRLQRSSRAAELFKDNLQSSSLCTAKYPKIATQSAIVFPQEFMPTLKRVKRGSGRSCHFTMAWTFNCWHMYGYSNYKSKSSYFYWKFEVPQEVGKNIWTYNKGCHFFKDGCSKAFQVSCSYDIPNANYKDSNCNSCKKRFC